ncbi:hypothetical protein [Bacillus sp. S/N-304-OC-R1]|uniref:hypothetical protein n=1 Tax=Bacillus sp. S/N-304-OC-R1 TaxID=2758034 RepID=UPI001C8EB2E6|nr:hypothetical protein [Bacillus sp. S/N-304-OC-R1]MBY0123125.1 hypothetical protein [Bacillus sp. S/N-304-OC-R1]
MKRNLLRKWIIGVMVAGFLLVQASHITYAEVNPQHEGKHHHQFISEQDMERLLDQGFSKKEILKAAHIAKYTNNKVDDVLNVYKKNDSSWDKTAEHYGLDMKKLRKEMCEHKEKFLQEHKEEVIENVAEYSGKKEKDIEQWVNDGIPLRFIVMGAAMAKVSNKNLEELIQMKKEGKSFREIKESLMIDREKLREEKRSLMKKIKEDIKD